MMTVEKLITQNIDIWSSALQTRSTAVRGSNSKIDLYGIKKLRDLILELAVRGKLVPQDPNDEPASELLKRIAFEKAELVKQGKIKKQKPLPEISEEEKPFELPEGWEWSSIQNLCLLENGDRSKNYPNKSTLTETGIPFVNTGHLLNGKIDEKEMTFIKESHFETLRSGKFLPGDILFCLRGSLGKSALVGNVSGAIASSLVIVRVYPLVNNKYVHFYFDSPISYQFIKKYDNGTAQPNLAANDLARFLIPVPPVDEQIRILGKIDDLMSLCDQLEQQSLLSLDAHQKLVKTLLTTLTDSQNAEELAENWARINQHFDTLFTTEASIDELKQTILQLAVMGKLVPQDPNDEPTSELLKRIEQEKAQLVKEGKIKKQKPLPPVSDEEKPFVLPMGWEWCRLGDLALGSEAGWSPQCESHPRNGDDWGVLKISAVTWGEFNAEENKALPVKLEPKHEYEVKGNDFLLSRANTSELVARSVVVPQTVPKHLMLSDKIIRFQFPDLIDVNYINIVNNSMLSREYYAIVAGGTSASMKNVTRNQVSLLPVALPPYNEKKKIISATESVLVLVDTLKDLITKSENIKKNLTDSIISHFEN